MLEHREIPAESRGHWYYDIVDAYAAIVPPKNGEYALDVLLAQEIAAIYVANQGNVPHWFAMSRSRHRRQDQRQGFARLASGRLG